LDKSADSLKWLNKNKDVLKSKEAKNMIIHNKITFYQNQRLDGTMERLYDILKVYKGRKSEM